MSKDGCCTCGWGPDPAPMGTGPNPTGEDLAKLFVGHLPPHEPGISYSFSRYEKDPTGKPFYSRYDYLPTGDGGVALHAITYGSGEQPK